jgi:hypothetical protein
MKEAASPHEQARVLSALAAQLARAALRFRALGMQRVADDLERVRAEILALSTPHAPD